MSERIPKINELIHHHIAELLPREVDFKQGVFVTVAKVDTTPDLRYTRIFISIFPIKETPYVLATLKKERGALQRKLNGKLHMKPLPRIVFQSDDTEEKADEVERLLRTL